MTAGSYCYIGPQGIVHGTFVCTSNKMVLREITNIEQLKVELYLLITTTGILFSKRQNMHVST